jgi:hypothetical protein
MLYKKGGRMEPDSRHGQQAQSRSRQAAVGLPHAAHKRTLQRPACRHNLNTHLQKIHCMSPKPTQESTYLLIFLGRTSHLMSVDTGSNATNATNRSPSDVQSQPQPRKPWENL